ncbi:Gamma-glutamyltranspeptidase precursor [Posidoniimonas polymericola]|uniref:Gamma-glutamyltranspeptidase n=1 Tax=Posidoniimonas polymericola TaxID=2528002 RepID=A0A5C5YTL0_9BACT|nr:gamma-glutamyltransferase [Posidoniimonas polymericola]TWT78315.1 Gamma-glutamyltranspeptidase precursor [Posidoniimonas polymericola]
MHSRLPLRLTFVALTLLLSAGPSPCAVGRELVVAKRFAVTSGHPAASFAGLKVLQSGGNVIDAAVTTSMAMGVAAPWGSGLGGKLVMLYREGDTGKIYCVEALNAAPQKLDTETFINLPRSQRRHGYASVCVPGLPAGLELAHRRWGELSWEAVVTPAAELAEAGVNFEPEMQPLFEHKTERLSLNPAAAQMYLCEKQLPALGKKLRFPKLAQTLREVAAHGADAFYRGDVAQRIVKVARSNGSALTLADFEQYRPRVIEPLERRFGDYEIATPPPPTTGGITVLAALGALEQVDWAGRDLRDLESIEQLSRVLNQLYPLVDRGIADHVKSLDAARQLLSTEGIEAIRNEALAVGAAASRVGQSAGDDLEGTLDDTADASTSHLVVADSEGNVACVTQSLSYHFGASVVAADTGVLLNNSMCNFNTRNLDSVNAIAPGKRPRSTIAPVIVMRDNEVRLAFGIPGGQRIASTTALILLDTLRKGHSLSEALIDWRYHLRRPVEPGQPHNQIDLEEGAPEDLRERLAARGWRSAEWRCDGSYFGGGNGVEYLPDGTLAAVADPRRTNDAMGQ